MRQSQVWRQIDCVEYIRMITCFHCFIYFVICSVLAPISARGEVTINKLAFEDLPRLLVNFKMADIEVKVTRQQVRLSM